MLEERIATIEYSADTIKSKIMADAMTNVREHNADIEEYAQKFVSRLIHKYGRKSAISILNTRYMPLADGRTIAEHKAINRIRTIMEAAETHFPAIIELCKYRDQIYIDAIKIARTAENPEQYIESKLQLVDTDTSQLLENIICDIATQVTIIKEAQNIVREINKSRGITNDIGSQLGSQLGSVLKREERKQIAQTQYLEGTHQAPVVEIATHIARANAAMPHTTCVPLENIPHINMTPEVRDKSISEIAKK
jgi:hypothetical protein